jgi:SPFH domain / Band 7 family
MKQLIVQANEIAINYKNGAIANVYTAGKHYIGFFDTVSKYEIGTPYQAPINMDIALQNEALQNLVDVITVTENTLVAKYYNGLFVELLRAGKYVYFKNVYETKYVTIDLNNYIIDEALDINLVNHPTVAAYLRAFTVETFEKGVLYIDGKFNKIVDAGQYKYFKNATVLHIAKADMRTIAMDLSGQEILTKDKAQLRLNFMVQYKIVDIMKYLVENKSAETQLYTTVQMAMRTVVGRLNIDELMEDKEGINKQILAETIENAAILGVQVIACGIKDIILPGDIKAILNQVLIAEKRAQANIITRREETASTRSLLNTAKLMEDNAMLWKLKEMEYVEKIAEKINTISLNGNGQIVDQLKTIFVK